MIPQEEIQFKVARDFGETFNISVKFIRQNFTSYFLCMLLLAGPFVLLYSISYAHYESVIQYKQSLYRAGRLYSFSKYGWEYFLSIVLNFISTLAVICTSLAYIVVYSEKGRNNFGATDVMKKMNSVLGKIIGGFLLYGFLVTIFVVAICFVVVMIIDASTVLGILICVVLFFAALIVLPNISWQMSTAFLVIIHEEEIPVSAYGRTREVMKDNYWWTWLVAVCSSLMFIFIALMFMIPEFVYMFIVNVSTGDEASESSILYIVVSTVCTFCATLVYSMNYIVTGFHYFSLVEKKDGQGLMLQINNIGKAEPASENIRNPKT
ncbi:MAG: hypothetical protein ACJ77K_15180 [Bacteroidia bacterium]